LKGLGAAYGGIFKAAAETRPLLYQGGKMATDYLYLQGFSEAYSLAKEGRLMNADERSRALLLNAGAVIRWDVAAPALTPLTKRVENAVAATGGAVRSGFRNELTRIDEALAPQRAAAASQLGYSRTGLMVGAASTALG